MVEAAACNAEDVHIKSVVKYLAQTCAIMTDLKALESQPEEYEVALAALAGVAEPCTITVKVLQ